MLILLTLGNNTSYNHLTDLNQCIVPSECLYSHSHTTNANFTSFVTSLMPTH